MVHLPHHHAKPGQGQKAAEEHHEWGSLDDVLHRLDTNTQSGLTSAEVQQRLEKHGRNELTEKKRNPILHYLSFMWNPLSWAMEVAAILAVILGDYLDFGLILGLLILNSTLGYYEERGAQNAIQALKEQLAPEANVLRDGQWKVIQAAELVPGDVVKINMGDIVSADAYVYDAVNLKVDQSSLTGESLPVSKKIGDEVYSGSSIKQGQLHGIVTETGAHTFFGRAATLVAGVDERGHFQKVLRAIGTFCIAFITVFVVAELIVQFVARHKGCNFPHGCKTLNNALVLIVGGVPIAMPTVLSVTLAIGASQLSKRKAIVSRLTAVEELAGMDILCSDKTGTLTKNELTLDRPVVFGKYTPDDVIMAAALASEVVSQDAIDKAVMAQLRDDMRAQKEALVIVKHQPFDAYSKRSFSQVRGPDGRERYVTKGAPQVVLGLCKNDADKAAAYTAAVDDFGKRGFRTLGVAEAEGSNFDDWRLMGLLPMFDPPRYDTAETIVRTKRQGIAVKMITGDQEAIAKELARRLDMGDNIAPLPRRHAGEAVPEEALLGMVEGADGFAQVLPEDKYNIVSALQSLGHTVAMTGDGVNDAPALKKADIGVAVAGATSAARAAADIVLTAPGLSTIVAAIIGARIIFQRMKNYSAYAISVTVRLVLTFFVLTVAFDFYYPTVILVILAVANDGSMLALSKDRVMPSKRPDAWRLSWLFLYATMIGGWLAISTITMFVLVDKVDNFNNWFGLRGLSRMELRGLIWIQVSVTGMGAIFSIRTRKWVWDSPPGILLVTAFVLSQILSTVLGVYGLRGFPDSERGVRGCGWGWAIFAWIYSFLWLLPLDLIKLAHRKLQDTYEDSASARWWRARKAAKLKRKQEAHRIAQEAAAKEQPNPAAGAVAVPLPPAAVPAAPQPAVAAPGDAVAVPIVGGHSEHA